MKKLTKIKLNIDLEPGKADEYNILIKELSEILNTYEYLDELNIYFSKKSLLRGKS